jgi:hypothetical protein
MAASFVFNDGYNQQARVTRTSLRCNGIGQNRRFALFNLPIDFGKTGAR